MSRKKQISYNGSRDFAPEKLQGEYSRIPYETMENMGKIILIIIVLAAIIGGAVFAFKRRKKKKEEKQNAIRRMREEALDRALANPMEEKNAESFEKQRRPFRVEYEKEDSGRTVGKSQMYQLKEITELSQKNYMFRRQELAYIGNQFGLVTVLPKTAEPSQIYCQIFFYQGENYVKSTGGEPVSLKRGKKEVAVTQNGIKLRSKDQFTVGSTRYQIEFIRGTQ